MKNWLALLFAVSLLVFLSVGSATAAPFVYRFEGSIANAADSAGAAAAASAKQNDPIIYEFLIDDDVDGQTTYHYSNQPNGLWSSANPDNPYVEMLFGNPIIMEVDGGLQTGADGDVYAWNFGEDKIGGYAYFQTGNADESVLLQSKQMNHSIADWTEGERFEFYMRAYDSVGNLTEVRAVSVPAAVWLLGSGLLGLAGIRKKLIG